MAASALWAALAAALATAAGAQPVPAESDSGPYDFLPDGYNPEEAPMQGMTVLASLILKKLHGVDPNSNIVRLTAEIVQYWYDGRLAGRPARWPGDADFIAINPDSIWTPDMEVKEKVDEFQQSCNMPKAALFSDRFVASLPPSVTKYNVFVSHFCTLPVKCKLVLRDFPFDRNRCNLTLSPWLDPSYRLAPANQSHADLITQEYETIMHNHPKFSTKKSPLPGGDEVDYDSLTFEIVISRFSRYYVVNLISPLLLMVSLSWFVFFTPPNKGDRLAYSVTLLLAAMAVQFITADKRPPEEQDGWIDHFQVGVYIMIIIPILETAVLYRIDGAFERRGQAAEGQRKVHRMDLAARIAYPVLIVLFIVIEMGPWSPVMQEHHLEPSPPSVSVVASLVFWVPIMFGLFACSLWNAFRIGGNHASDSIEALQEAFLDPTHDAIHPRSAASNSSDEDFSVEMGERR